MTGVADITKVYILKAISCEGTFGEHFRGILFSWMEEGLEGKKIYNNI